MLPLVTVSHFHNILVEHNHHRDWKVSVNKSRFVEWSVNTYLENWKI